MEACGRHGRGMTEETAYCTICRQALGANGRCAHCDEDGHVWSVEDWRPLLTLALVIVLGFSFTRLVVTSFNEKQDALAREFYATGIHALAAGRAAEAVDALETALVYSHDNFQYRLKLTDALLANGAADEALAQLHAFWEQRPGDAQVNLKLARLEAGRKHEELALRYYLNAIEGAWPERTDPVPQKIAVRFESAEYLVELGRTAEAEGALLALAAVLPEGSAEQPRLAELFLRNGDTGRALTAYQIAMVRNKNDEAAMLGAARASFAAGNYPQARRYLGELKTETAAANGLREQLARLEALDPFARGSTGKVRTERTVAAFQIALGRLAGCGVGFAQAMTGTGKGAKAADPAQWSGFARWGAQLAPMMSERKLYGRDDVIESTMRFAFQAEMAAEKNCGKATADDETLLLLARARMGAKE